MFILFLFVTIKLKKKSPFFSFFLDFFFGKFGQKKLTKLFLTILNLKQSKYKINKYTIVTNEKV